MSEDFDKEAERERLREKYENDREDRESTERMSELLLQGATMTNRHCDTCGSPIFRYQGQEFCPNCQMEAAGDGDAQTEPEGRATEPESSATEAEPAASSQTPQTGRAEPTPAESREPASPDGPAPGSRMGTGRGSDASVPQAEQSAIEGSRSDLTETLARFSRLAAETDDPNRAREYLQAAKSAAETIRALPR